MKQTIITDEQELHGAKSRFGSAIRTYDDGYGPLWIHRNSMGITGIARARTWGDAYSIFEDEFFPAADEEAVAEAERIDEMEEGKDKDHDQACWDESYGYRGNPLRMPDGLISVIYSKDLNGDFLDLLTPELVETLEITLDIRDPEPEPEPPVNWHHWHLRRIPIRGRVFIAAEGGKYGASSRLCAGLRFHMKRITKNDHY